MIINPGSAEWRGLFDGFRSTAFRLETLQVYEDEAEPLRCFMAGEPKPPMPDKDRWCSRVTAAIAAGKTMARVHYVRLPLTAYMRYELEWSYPANVAAGEDVRIMETDVTGRDFWLFDRTTLLWLDYDSEGRMTGAELEEDAAVVLRANAVRDATMRASMAFSDFMKETKHVA